MGTEPTPRRERVDVLILGANLAGVSLACSLKNKGLRVLLVEKTKEPTRALKGEFLQPVGVHILSKVGFEDLLQHSSVQKVRHLRFRDMSESGQIISETKLSYPKGCYALSISHLSLGQYLRSKARLVLNEMFVEGAYTHWVNPEVGFDSDELKFEIKSEYDSIEVNARWVVGCDGKHSSVRNWIKGPAVCGKGPTVLFAPSEILLGAEIQNPKTQKHQYEVVRTHKNGTLAYFSLGKTQRLYWNLATQNFKNLKLAEQSLKSLTDQHKAQLVLKKGFSSIQGAPANTTWYGPAYRGRFLLAGDALFVTTPIGGQGMSSALLQANYLLENFDFCKSQSSRHQVQSYEAFTKDLFYRINNVNFFLYYLFFSRNPLIKKATKQVLTSWSYNSYAPERVIELFSGMSTYDVHISEILELCGLDQLPFLGSLAQKMKNFNLTSDINLLQN